MYGVLGISLAMLNRTQCAFSRPYLCRITAISCEGRCLGDICPLLKELLKDGESSALLQINHNALANLKHDDFHLP